MTAPQNMAHIDIYELSFDVGNPRIADLLETYSGSITVDQIALALMPGGQSFVSLREAIRTHGAIINPIKVNKSEDGYTVFEGNTRLAIYRDFHESGAQGDWSTIPCMVYENLSNLEIDRLRLQDHLIGTREWSPFAKARYLNHLSTEEGMPLEDLVSFCGGNKSHTIRMIDAYISMENNYRRAIRDDPNLNEDDDFDTRKFTAFEEFEKPNRKMAVAKAGFNELDFASWVANGKFDRNEDVRDLPKILGDRQARKEFLENGSRAAKRFLHVDPEKILKTITVGNLCRALSQAVQELPLSELNDIRDEQEEVDAIQDALSDLTLFVRRHLQD